MKRIDVVENTILEALTDPEITIDREYAERLLNEYAEAKAGQHETIVMQTPFIRRYLELLKLTEEDCSCGRIARCDSCCAASALNEVEELVKTEHGRLFA